MLDECWSSGRRLWSKIDSTLDPSVKFDEMHMYLNPLTPGPDYIRFFLFFVGTSNTIF